MECKSRRFTGTHLGLHAGRRVPGVRSFPGRKRLRGGQAGDAWGAGPSSVVPQVTRVASAGNLGEVRSPSSSPDASSLSSAVGRPGT